MPLSVIPAEPLPPPELLEVTPLLELDGPPEGPAPLSPLLPELLLLPDPPLLPVAPASLKVDPQSQELKLLPSTAQDCPPRHPPGPKHICVCPGVHVGDGLLDPEPHATKTSAKAPPVRTGNCMPRKSRVTPRRPSRSPTNRNACPTPPSVRAREFDRPPCKCRARWRI